MSYKCEILADSKNIQGDRITTMKITFPRFILAEFNTHRMFSRNSASSRAIPFNKMVKMVEENPFIPIAWQIDHKGMQGTEYLTLPKNNGDIAETTMATSNWLSARDNAIKLAQALHSDSNGYGSVTKQLCNRLLEPFMWHTVIITATEFENFFKLRCPQYHTPVSGEGFYFRSKKDCIANHSAPENLTKLENMTDLEWLQINQSQADIHIQAIAELMWDAMNESTPLQLEAGEWHIPNFGHEWDNDKLLKITKGDLSKRTEARIKISTAHNARISYETLGDNPKIDYEADIKLHDMLAESGHWSPFEHVARAMSNDEYLQYFRSSGNVKFKDKNDLIRSENGWCRNFKGFIQYRSLIDNNI
jgi:thymidylate synthase ThyX